MASITAEQSLSLPLEIEGIYDEEDATPAVRVTHAWLTMDGQPDLDVLPYLGHLDYRLVTRRLQADLDATLEDRSRP